MAKIATVPAADIPRLAAAGATILDVRTPGEHAQQSLVAKHALLPLDALDPADFMLKRGLDKDAPVYILCRSGMRAKTAAEKFAAAGYGNDAVIEGGILAAAAAGVEVTSAVAQGGAAPRFIPLERQVRIVAGALSALGTLLGFYAAPAFYLVPFFIGLGLMYAGITDRCGMALVLIKMPWNKGMTASCCAAANTCDTGGDKSGLPQTPDNSAAGGCA